MEMGRGEVGIKEKDGGYLDPSVYQHSLPNGDEFPFQQSEPCKDKPRGLER